MEEAGIDARVWLYQRVSSGLETPYDLICSGRLGDVRTAVESVVVGITTPGQPMISGAISRAPDRVPTHPSLDCGGGYHFVLSGLDRLDAQVGQPLQPGEPVGVMPEWDPRISGGVGSTARPSLYVELRKDGVAVNPAPFLRSRS